MSTSTDTTTGCLCYLCRCSGVCATHVWHAAVRHTLQSLSRKGSFLFPVFSTPLCTNHSIASPPLRLPLYSHTSVDTGLAFPCLITSLFFLVTLVGVHSCGRISSHTAYRVRKVQPPHPLALVFHLLVHFIFRPVPARPCGLCKARCVSKEKWSSRHSGQQFQLTVILMISIIHHPPPPSCITNDPRAGSRQAWSYSQEAHGTRQGDSLDRMTSRSSIHTLWAGLSPTLNCWVDHWPSRGAGLAGQILQLWLFHSSQWTKLMIG